MKTEGKCGLNDIDWRWKMTNKEAISYLEQLILMFLPDDPVVEAIKIAIEAIKRDGKLYDI